MAELRGQIAVSLSAVNDTIADKLLIKGVMNSGTANFVLEVRTGAAYDEPFVFERGLANSSVYVPLVPAVPLEQLRVIHKGTDPVILLIE